MHPATLPRQPQPFTSGTGGPKIHTREELMGHFCVKCKYFWMMFVRQPCINTISGRIKNQLPSNSQETRLSQKFWKLNHIFFWGGGIDILNSVKKNTRRQNACGHFLWKYNLEICKIHKYYPLNYFCCEFS